jgi:hypothetical protein
MRALLIVGWLAASHSVSATTFEFAGLGLATTLQDVVKRYPESVVSGSYVHLSPKDSHDHIFGIELSGPIGRRLRISFGSPDHKYPSCDAVERRVSTRHGPATEVREFNEEAMRNRYLVWELKLETVQLQCFRSDATAAYLAEAIAVHPIEPKPALPDAAKPR